MLRPERYISCLILGLFVLTDIGVAQAPHQKPPVLIRDTGVAEGKTDPETAKKKEYNPLLADESLKVGNYYFKRGNYPAAIERFQEAIDYQPSLVEAYDALGRALEKNGDKQKALAVYRDFLKKYPQSPKATEFKSRCAKLEKQK